MPQQPKVFASVFSRKRVEGSPVGEVSFVLDYVYLSDPKRSGKSEVSVVIHRLQEGVLVNDLKDALAEKLSILYPNEQITGADIVGCGV